MTTIEANALTSDQLQILEQNLYPKDLIYWRRMGAKEIREYVLTTPAEKQLILIPWGVLEAHGPAKPVASDSIMSHVVTDLVSRTLTHHADEKTQRKPIILDSFMDVGSYSPTEPFTGALALEEAFKYTPNQPSPIVDMWSSIFSRLTNEGFKSFYIINGDGGNWMNYVKRPGMEDFSSVFEELASYFNIKIGISNWDQEGGNPWKHADHFSHAAYHWLTTQTEDKFLYFAKLRAGAKTLEEEQLQAMDGRNHVMIVDGKRVSKWDEIRQDPESFGQSQFSYETFQDYLSSGKAEEDFRDKVRLLQERVIAFIS